MAIPKKLQGKHQEIVDKYLTGNYSHTLLARIYGVDHKTIGVLLKTLIAEDLMSSIISKTIHRHGGTHHAWKGGKRIKRGYVEIRVAGSYLKEHQVIASRTIDRCLEEGEIVHHINGDQLDNRAKNLLVLPSRAAHTQLHYHAYRKFGELFPEIMEKINAEFAQQLPLSREGMNRKIHRGNCNLSSSTLEAVAL